MHVSYPKRGLAPRAPDVVDSPRVLVPPDDQPGVRRRRILRGLVREVGGLALLTVLFPLLIVAAAAVDLALWLRRRKPWMAVRLLVLVWWFLLCEVRGLLGVLRTWVLSGGPFARDTDARRRRVYRLQVDWATRNLACVRRLWRLRFEVDGQELVGSGPVIVLYRHASIIDNALPAELISKACGIDLRYVLKDDLQSLPTLDLGARWVPTCFVHRASADPAREIERVRMLAHDLTRERDGVLIFPEGTRGTPAKLAALKGREDIGDEALRERIAQLRVLLPPRTGGPLAVLDEAPHAAVVVCGHTGLEGFNTTRTLWGGELVDATIRVRFWRHERSELPDDPEELAEWLFDRWQQLDDWTAGVREPVLA
jgi:1-acyl-sn-glycerol-3-phosphate acyltransferase